MNAEEIRVRVQVMLEAAVRIKRAGDQPMYYGNGRWLHSEKAPEGARAQGVADACRLVLAFLSEETPADVEVAR